MKQLALLLLFMNALFALEFTISEKGESLGDKNTVLIFGGMQGDEPGGFHAASLLISDYNITKGKIIVAPNLAFDSIIKKLDFVTISKLQFHSINLNKYPLFALKDEFLANLDLGVVINAANEIQVEQFLAGKCGFLDISKGIFKALKHFQSVKISNLDEIFELDDEVRKFCKRLR